MKKYRKFFVENYMNQKHIKSFLSSKVKPMKNKKNKMNRKCIKSNMNITVT